MTYPCGHMLDVGNEQTATIAFGAGDADALTLLATTQVGCGIDLHVRHTIGDVGKLFRLGYRFGNVIDKTMCRITIQRARFLFVNLSATEYWHE